jgi:ribonuclease R
MNNKTMNKSRNKKRHVAHNDKHDRLSKMTHDVLAILRREGHPLSENDLATALKSKGGDRQTLNKALYQMAAAGHLVRNRKGVWGLPERMDIFPARINAHPDGHGNAVPDSKGEWLYLPPREMRQVMHGDRVLCCVASVDRRGRASGQIVEVLERAVEHVVGRYLEQRGVGIVIPDDPRLHHDVMVNLPEHLKPEPGQVVVAKILEQPASNTRPVGEVTEILGNAGAPGMATEIAIRSYGLPHEWPGPAIAAAKALPTEVSEASKVDRKDLRALPLVTIDGADARDFDDAVYCLRRKQGWRLVVAIADVAAYVMKNDELDRSALQRGTSTYFPNKVVPMLPEELSNELCSLKPEVDRLAMVCDMSFSDEGKITRVRFYEAVIHSHARLTYNQVQEYLDTQDGTVPGYGKDVCKSIDDFHQLWQVLDQRRRNRGAIDFESFEVKILFNSDGEVGDIVARERLDTHRMIEEAMIAANVEAARFLQRRKIPALYRVHDAPPMSKLDDLVQFLLAQGLRISWKEQPEPQDFAKIMEAVAERPNKPLVQAMLLRSQSLAAYREENEGHFGLALDAYAHFTSPIRRYPDLLVHRALKHAIRGGKRRDYQYSAEEMERLAEHCSFTERRAEEASRDVIQRLQCVYLQAHIGEVFTAMVTGVTGFGMFVELDQVRVSGLVHISTLPGDYYHYDPLHQRMTGERRGRSYSLAQRVRVKVMAVRVDERKIDLELAP